MWKKLVPVREVDRRAPSDGEQLRHKRLLALRHRSRFAQGLVLARHLFQIEMTTSERSLFPLPVRSRKTTVPPMLPRACSTGLPPGWASLQALTSPSGSVLVEPETGGGLTTAGAGEEPTARVPAVGGTRRDTACKALPCRDT